MSSLSLLIKELEDETKEIRQVPTGILWWLLCLRRGHRCSHDLVLDGEVAVLSLDLSTRVGWRYRSIAGRLAISADILRYWRWPRRGSAPRPEDDTDDPYNLETPVRCFKHRAHINESTFMAKSPAHIGHVLTAISSMPNPVVNSGKMSGKRSVASILLWVVGGLRSTPVAMCFISSARWLWRALQLLGAIVEATAGCGEDRLHRGRGEKVCRSEPFHQTARDQ